MTTELVLGTVGPLWSVVLPLDSTWSEAVGARTREGAYVASDTGRRRGLLTPGELERLMAAGEIDTVIVAFADMQGRLTGKRVSARLFAEEVAAHGAECCNYLLAVDVEMNTVDGYAMSSWASGYGDMVMVPT